jgi:hypothetical protein
MLRNLPVVFALALTTVACQKKAFFSEACAVVQGGVMQTIVIRVQPQQKFRSPLARSIVIFSNSKACSLSNVDNDAVVSLNDFSIAITAHKLGEHKFGFPDGSACIGSITNLSLGFYPLDERLLSSNELTNLVKVGICKAPKAPDKAPDR